MTEKSGLEDVWPLSPLQEGMLFHALFDEHALDVYTMQLVLDFEGALEAGRLRVATQALIDRHSCLRVALVLVNDPPVQVVVRGVQVPWKEVDLSDWPIGDRSRQFNRVVEDDRITRFDLQTPPLLRFLLVKIDDTQHRLVMSVHHILFDGWSTPLILRELFALYASNGSVALPNVRPYRDHLMWLSTRDRAAASAAWAQALKGIDEPTLLAATDLARPPALPKQVTADISEELTAQLISLARDRGLTMNTLVQVGWAVVLSRSTGRSDVVFGKTVSGRPPELAEAESMIGLFINTIPVRVRLDPAESLADLMSRIQDEQSRLFDYQYVGLAELQRAVGIGDLFDTLVVFQSFPTDPVGMAQVLDGTGMTLTGFESRDSTHYPISLVAVPDTRLQITLEYRPDCFDYMSVQALTDRLVRVLEAMVADPDVRMSAVDVLSVRTRHQMLTTWNSTAAEVEKTTVSEMFASQVAQTPDAIAVVCSDKSLTYAELEERVDRLARHLITHGAGPERVVGVCLERSADLVVALLGVLRTSASFVALDPEWPVARIEQVCRSSGGMIVVTGAATAGVGPADVIEVNIEDIPDLSEPGPGASVCLSMPADADNLAYTIFTSGSTGAPKGVMIRHCAIGARLSWQREMLGFGPGDAVLFKAPLGFDISINELLLPLVSGARLVVAEPGGERDIEYLLEVIEREQVTFVYLVPSMLDMLLELPEIGDRAKTLRHVWCGGEALATGLFDRFQTKLNTIMHHGYGPAEATIGVTHQCYRPGQPRDGVTIGRPNPNTRIYVLDQFLCPVPVDVIGELYIGGLPLARGYVNDPALTASHFVADPFSSGERLYRTGDLSRWRADGILEFCGRIDNQIKIRGMRVETGEIESVLTQHPEIAHAVVVARNDSATAGRTRLIGYVVPEELSGQARDELEHEQIAVTRRTSVLLAQLRDDLKRQLPDYMVPAELIPLERLPLTANGKLDMKALPDPEPVARQVVNQRPKSAQEQLICELFADVLGLPEVGVEDNFFELGGDSIIAIQLVNRTRKQDLPISLREVFQHRTPAALADLVIAKEPAAKPASDPDGVGSIPPLPVVQRFSELGGPLECANQHILVQVPAAIDWASVGEILQAVLDQHDGLRLLLTRHAPALWSVATTAVGSVQAVGLLRRVDVTNLEAETVRAMIAAELNAAVTRLDPDSGVMLQAVWFDAGQANQGWLLVVAHRLVIDRVSWRILLEDIAAGWLAVRAGNRPQLDSVGTSLRSFAQTFVEQAHDPARFSEIEHWIQTLSPGGDLVTKSMTAGTVSEIRHHRIRLPVSETALLLTSVPAAASAEVLDILLAALRVAVSQWHERQDRDGSVDFLVDLELPGREKIASGMDLSRTVGCFTSISPIRLLASSNAISTLKRVKGQLRAMPDGGIGYEMLRYANPQTASLLAGASQPQVLFSYCERLDVGRRGDWTQTVELDAVEVDSNTAMSAPYLLTINVMCADTPEGPQLQGTFTYRTEMLSAEATNQLADSWTTALHELIALITSDSSGGILIPSDFSLLSLSQQKIDLLQQKSTAPVEDIWPLSPLQEGLLFHALFDEKSLDVYTIQLIFDLEGLLDAARLRIAAQALLDRHPCLRASFVADNNPPVQVIVRGVPVPWVEVDLSGWPAEEREGRFERLLQDDRVARFDLQRPPMIRFLLVKIDDAHHRLVISNHHILFDGWSLPLVLSDLFALYVSGGDGSALPEVRSYRDHLTWLSTRDRGAALAAWAHTLKGIEGPTLLVGADRVRPPMLPEQVDAGISERLTSQLMSLARVRGLTMHTVVQVAWAVVLSRLVGHLDVVFGTTVSGRPPELPEVESMVGLFINTVPVRIQLDAAESLADLLCRVQDEQSRMLDYQYVGLGELQAELGVDALFDTLTVFESLPFGSDRVTRTLKGTAIDITETKLCTSMHYPLSAVVIPGSRLQITLEYRPDVFDCAEVRTIADRLVRVLEGIAAEPDMQVGKVDVLSTKERNQLLLEWKGTSMDAPNVLLPELFEQQVVRTPDATAVVSDGASLSYTELNKQANRLARLLIERGAGPEKFVALALSRSADLIVALLAVLKSGAGYLPIDLSYPVDRIAFMLLDTGPMLVITASGLTDRLPPSDATRVVLDEADTREQLAAYRDADIEEDERHCASSLSNSAYVIYTSGSTGRPKGVVVSLGGLGNFLAAMRQRFVLGQGDRLLAVTTVGFDISNLEIFVPLLSGATVVLASRDVVQDPLTLCRTIIDANVSVMQATPSLWRSVVAEEIAGLSDVRVLVGGEALPVDLAASLTKRASSVTNLYGPTETTIWATATVIDEHTARDPSIGRPIGNTQIYILDPNLQPAPVGAPGELYIAGVQLARCYVNQEGLTATRFVANPFGEPGSRMYRTGDLVRWTTESVVQYLGRADEQVKIRGFRIELGEIESVLADHPSVSQVVVTARDDGLGSKYLAAYVVPIDGATLDASELRAQASSILPDYMIPAVFVVLDGGLPLAPSGKIDRRGLPAPDRQSMVGSREPANPVEQVLCELFAEILVLERVGVNDSFFELGGHSLVATRLISRVRSTLNAELSVRAIFESPTVAGLAQQLHVADHIPLIPVKRPEIVPLSFAQQRLWFLHQMDGSSSTYNLPHAARLRGDLNIVALEAALGDVIERHETLRTVFPDESGQPRQQVLPVELAWPGLPVVDINEKQLAGELARAAGHRFDLDREPPLRARLFRLADEEYVLSLLMHHIASDEWSSATFFRDLFAAYVARTSDVAPSWDPLPVQYIDFTIWQRAMLGDETDPNSKIAAQAHFWVESLAGAPEELALPLDRPRRSVPTHRGGSVSFPLPAELCSRLRDLAHQCGASEFMVVEAAVAMMLSKLGVGKDIPLGTPIAGRTDDALDELVGFFVNTLVLRNDLSGNPTFREIIGRVRDTALAAYAHQDIPFERLVEILSPERSLSRHPLIQTIVGYENRRETIQNLPGVEVNRIAGEVGTAKFDLTFWFVDRGKDGGIEGRVEYHADVFDRPSAELLGARLLRVLQAMVATPEARLADLDILTADERRTFIVECNDTATEIPDRTLLELLEQQAKLTPEATAVVFKDTSLSYAELDVQAAQLGRYLAGRGIGPEQIVGVCLDRSINLIVTLIGVLKAGAAFVPLEPSWPAQRIIETCRTSCLAAVVTDDPAKFPIIDNVFAVGIADGADTSSSETAGVTDGRACINPECLAYVIFTSGSTGTPKGAMIRHGAIAARLSWQRNLLELSTRDAVLFKAPLGFDISINEIFLPLVSGARLVVAEPGGERDIEYLLEVIEREQVTFVYLVSSMLDMLLQLPDVARRAQALKHVWCGGEALGPGLFNRFRASLETTMYHGYGPAELTIGVTHQSYRPGQSRDKVTIGTPNPNTRIYLLDESLRLVPTGVIGELYAGGLPLARGYVNDPKLTAARFIADPFTPGGRLYRTGDLARWCTNGVLEFCGRADNQVKIRGMRVELEEIEAVLQRHTHIRQAVVTVDISAAGTTRLISYQTTTSDQASHARLRTWAATQLPEHMVPSVFVTLPTLPLTPNGKIDRQALPTPSLDRDLARVESAPPRGAEEMMMAQVWVEVLGLDQVGREDNFFELGGDSMLAARLVFRLRKVLDIEISLRQLFQYQTIAELAAALTCAGRAEAGQRREANARGQRNQGMPPWPEPLPPLTPHCGDNVLLTGATGFFGAFLLRELLSQYRGKVHCLVRAETTAQAWGRLQANLERYRLWDEILSQDRIRLVVGDLARPRLGLDDDEYERLSGEIDLIIHNGAQVDMLHFYETLEAVNVNGTQELLLFAATTWCKPLRFVSTSSVTGYRPAKSGGASGYIESKWRAEQVVAEARAHGIPAAVYRVPRLSGDSRTGLGNDHDMMFRTIRWILNLRTAPDVDFSEGWIPVDEAARLLVGPYPSPEHGGSFALTAQRQVRLAEIIEFARGIGHEIEYKKISEWLRDLASQSVEEHELLASVLGADSAGGTPDEDFSVAQEGTTVPIVAYGVTEQVLRRYLHTMSPVDRIG